MNTQNNFPLSSFNSLNGPYAIQTLAKPYMATWLISRSMNTSQNINLNLLSVSLSLINNLISIMLLAEGSCSPCHSKAHQCLALLSLSKTLYPHCCIHPGV